MESQAMEKLKRARTHLLLSNNFDQTVIGSISMQYPLIETDNYQGKVIKTAATNGVNIFFNPEYVNGLNHKQSVFLIAHETMNSTFPFFKKFPPLKWL